MGIFDWLFGGKKTTPASKIETIVVENKEKVNSHNFFQLNLNSIDKEEIRFEINNTNKWISQLSKNLEKDKNEYIKFYSPKDSCEKVFYEWEAVKVLLNQLKKTRNIDQSNIIEENLFPFFEDSEFEFGFFDIPMISECVRFLNTEVDMMHMDLKFGGFLIRNFSESYGFEILDAWQSEIIWEKSKQSKDGEKQAIYTHFKIDINEDNKIFGIKNYILGQDIEKSADYIKHKFYFTDELIPNKIDSINILPVVFENLKSNNNDELEENISALNDDTLLEIYDNQALDWWQGESLDI